ncbi:MAG: ImmA/IrrE family metallo-endopeptidase [Anaerolineae bacterium]|nr:ImmA/IrrE family metallo-endopeptidase [Anaerolineae bacterium]
MEPRVLKTEADYEAALAYVETLMDAAPGSAEETRLEVFALLIDAYEQAHYPIDLPDPVEAIKFRMEQQGLQQKDLAPYLGSQSKVSEVLNHKRPLSLTMIRALHEGLGIPAEVLLQTSNQESADYPYNPQDYPFAEMFKRGYFDPFAGSLQEARLRARALLNDFFSIFAGAMPRPVFYRRTGRAPDVNALLAWQAQALHLARAETLPDYDPAALDDTAMRTLVQQSYFSTGPQNARELLNRWGIHVIILRHLPRTYLDGASFLAPWGHPVVGLTLRYDRLDNFWFTLLHELGHVRLHLEGQRGVAFFDNTERIQTEPDDASEDAREREAHAFAQERLISADVWARERPAASDASSERVVKKIAETLRVSAAIVAGRIRWETQNYTQLGTLVGAHQVREQLEEYKVEE